MRKHRPILMIFLMIICVSCKKSNSSGNYITCSVNGIQKSFDFQAKAYNTTYLNGTVLIALTGYLNSTAGSPEIELAISNSSSSNPIVPGIYYDSSSIFDVSSIYYKTTFNNSSDSDYVANPQVVRNAIFNNIAISHLAINISYLSKSSIQGTFSGDYYFGDDTKSTPISITNGNFNLSF